MLQLSLNCPCLNFYNLKFISVPFDPSQGDSYEKVDYTRHLVEGYKSMILVSLKVFMVERTILTSKSIF